MHKVAKVFSFSKQDLKHFNCHFVILFTETSHHKSLKNTTKNRLSQELTYKVFQCSVSFNVHNCVVFPTSKLCQGHVSKRIPGLVDTSFTSWASQDTIVSILFVFLLSHTYFLLPPFFLFPFLLVFLFILLLLFFPLSFFLLYFFSLFEKKHLWLNIESKVASFQVLSWDRFEKKIFQPT